MPSVAELTAVYGNFMVGPRHGPGVCRRCFNLTSGFELCFACDQMPQELAAVAPISYSIAGEQLHHALYGYKRLTGPAARRFTVELAAILWRYLAAHEKCVARAVGIEHEAFDLVTTVPSGDRERDEDHPLRRIVGELVGSTRERYERRLRRTEAPAKPRAFDRGKYRASGRLDGASVLLIDDTWTTGASARSAAHALRSAGATTVAVVVIGRHINRDWGENDARLRAHQGPFDWDACAFCEGGSGSGR
jgi:predicted amidophosphoribosyltransferase